MPVALDGLNRAQEAAVTHADGPLVVAAGAGTGKTRTVVQRFRRLVEEGLPAEGILALTFSAPAAADLRARLEEVLEAPYEELHVETFRSFCLRLLQDEALEACVDPFLSPVTAADRLALLLERIDDLSLRARWSPPASMRTTTACLPSAARSTSATSSCAPSGCSTNARTCARGSPAASSTCSWTSTTTPTSPRACSCGC